MTKKRIIRKFKKISNKIDIARELSRYEVESVCSYDGVGAIYITLSDKDSEKKNIQKLSFNIEENNEKEVIRTMLYELYISKVYVYDRIIE